MTKPETLDQLRARLSTEKCGLDTARLETAVKDGITITYTPQELFGVDYKAFEDAVTQFANEWITAQRATKQ